MTPFTNALRELADRMPETFGIRGDSIHWVIDPGTYRRGGNMVALLTSDDLDQIAGLLGWEFEVVKLRMIDSWDFRAWNPKVPLDVLQTDDVYQTKLEASRAALTAIIKEVVKP